MKKTKKFYKLYKRQFKIFSRYCRRERWSAILMALIILISFLAIGAANVRAAARYAPGQTLTPDCGPTDPDCTVSSPLYTSASLDIGSSPQAGYYTATSTTATSVLAGGLSVAGTAGLTVLLNGNVGIGTTSPYAKLSVEGSSVLGNSATAGYFTATSTTATSTFAGALIVAGSSANVTNSSIAAWGDSITMGACASSSQQSYPNTLSSLTGDYVYNAGVSGATSIAIASKMLADTSKYGWAHIVWAGHNNASSVSQVESDIASMVTALGNNNRYLVLSLLNDTGTINNYLATTYGSHYVDVRSYLVSQYNPSIPQDVIDYNNNSVPSSLRCQDGSIHLSNAGYALVAQYIYNNYINIIEPSQATVLTTSNIGDIAKQLLSPTQNPVLTGMNAKGPAFYVNIANGYVGFGTSAPQAQLDIYRNTDNYTGPSLQDSAVIKLTRGYNNGIGFGSAIYDGYGTSGETLVFGVAHSTDPSAAGNEKMVIQNNGFVGIGTTSPATTLDVQCNDINCSSWPATSGSSQTGLNFRLHGSTNISLDFGNDQNYGFWLQATNPNNLATNYPLLLNPNGGFVGIGTTSPQANLDISLTPTGNNPETFFVTRPSSIKGVMRMKVAQDGAFTSITNNASIAYSNSIITTGTTDHISRYGSEMLLEGGVGATGKNFEYRILPPNGSQTLFTVYTILNNGNFGIGTSSPSSKLTVNGTSYFAGAMLATSSVTFTGLSTNAVASALCIDSNGLISTASVAACSGVSSLRFKHDILDTELGLSTILNLHPVSFRYNQGFGDSGKDPQFGLVAEEVQKIDSRLIILDSGGLPTAVRYDFLPTILVKAVQELSAKIDNFVTQGIANIKNLVVDLLTAKKVQTAELCVDDVCIDKIQLKSLLQNANLSGVSPDSTPTSTPAPTPSLSPDPLISPTPTPEAIAEPEIIPTPTPVPSPTPTPEPTPPSVDSGQATPTIEPTPSAIIDTVNP